jgi:hypothetical protein
MVNTQHKIKEEEVRKKQFKDQVERRVFERKQKEKQELMEAAAANVRIRVF